MQPLNARKPIGQHHKKIYEYVPIIPHSTQCLWLFPSNENCSARPKHDIVYVVLPQGPVEILSAPLSGRSSLPPSHLLNKLHESLASYPPEYLIRQIRPWHQMEGGDVGMLRLSPLELQSEIWSFVWVASHSNIMAKLTITTYHCHWQIANLPHRTPEFDRQDFFGQTSPTDHCWYLHFLYNIKAFLSFFTTCTIRSIRKRWPLHHWGIKTYMQTWGLQNLLISIR